MCLASTLESGVGVPSCSSKIEDEDKAKSYGRVAMDGREAMVRD